MVLRKTVCLRRLGGDRGGELQAGRFFANRKVTAAKIVASWGAQTGSAVAGRHVLAIEDTTAVSFATAGECKSAKRGKTRRGLGPLNEGSAHGLLAHVMLGIDADSRACLGLVGGEVWNRKGFVKTPEWKRPLAQRESRRWIETAERAAPVLAEAAMVTVVTDREGDMYPLWGRVPALGWHVLSRVRRPSIRPKAAAFAVAGTRVLALPPRPGQAKRKAQVAVRFGTVDIVRSPNEKDRSLPKTVRLTLIDVREIDPPADVEAIDWQLLTTHEVATADQAWQIVGWYQLRWCIEQLFRIMKSQGLQLEDSQMDSAERLTKLTAAAVKAACITLQLVQERDGTHGLPAELVFDEAETDTIEALIPTLEGKTERQKNPHPPRGLARASWVIARLGGWNCYYKPPGPITMHRGMQRFHAIHEGRMLALTQK
jgi:hypothetical protein